MSGQHSAFVPLAAMMFAAGLGIPMFASLNAGLGQQLQGAVAATAVSFTVGLLVALAVLSFTGFPAAASFTLEKPYLYFGAVFMLFYASAVAFSAPKIGLGNAIFFVLMGQLISAALIDHFGLLGVIQSSLTPKRVIGLFVMAIGLYLARKPV
ncbi:MAG: DMT family transporter [Sphingomonadaceae bacterium]